MATANSTAVSTERLCNFQVTLNDFIRESMDYVQLVAPEGDKSRLTGEAEVLCEHLRCLTANAKCLLGAVQTQQKVVQGLTSAVYNLIAQRDSLLNVETARDSKSIALSSKRDSSAMKALAILTMVFLPGS